MRKSPEDMSLEELVKVRDRMIKRIKYLNYWINEAKGVSQ